MKGSGMTNDTQHTQPTPGWTPGPWTCLKRDGSVSKYVEGNGFTIAEVSPTNSPEADANARLIAASPDLLAVLIRLIEAMEDGDNHSINDAKKLAMDAIGKAVGR